MTLNTYASLRSTPTGVTFSSESGGSLTGGTTYYLWFQTRNRIGLSLHSAVTTIAPTAGQKIVCAIAPSVVATGEDLREVWISASLTNDSTTAKLIGIWRYRNALTLDGIDYPGEGTPKTLPDSVEFTRDAHMAIALSVANSAALPNGISLKNGMLREVTDQAEVWRWDEEASAGKLASNGGYWVLHNRGFLVGDSFSTYYGDETTLLGGCDRPLEDLSGDEYELAPPPYPANGAEQDVPLVLWVSNGLNTDGGAILSAGTKLALQIKVDGENRSTAFDGKAIARLLGYIDRATGVLDTDVDTVGADIVLGGTTADETPRLSGLEIPQDMTRGQAAAYSLSLQFASGEIPGLVDGSSVSVLIYPSGELGTLNAALWAVTGDLIFADGDRFRIVPAPGGFRRLSGAAIIKRYTTPESLSATDFTGLADDTAGQQIAISGSLGGFCVVRSPLASLLTTEALRAIVSTESGEYTASSVTSGLAIATANNKGLQITVSYPCTADGLGTVRSDYPDSRIAGNGLGAFNVPRLRVYVNDGSTITRLTQEITVTPGVSQTFTITSLAGTAVPGLPNSSANPSFNLWAYGTVSGSVIDTSSAIAPGTYTVAVAYYYPSPNGAVAKINHDPGSGCIDELGSTLTEAASIADYWGDPVADEAALVGIGDNISKIRYVLSRDRLSRQLGDGHAVWEWALLNEVGIFEKPQGYEVVTLTSTGGAIALDLSASGKFYIELIENINSVVVSNLVAGVSYELYVKQGAPGGFLITGWPAGFRFAGGVAYPELDPVAGTFSIVAFSSPNGVDILAPSVTNF